MTYISRSIDFAFYDCHRFKLFVYIKTFDFKINVVHCDLYFMVQWFCLISWRLDVWTSFFGIMSQYDPTIDLKISVGHWDLYFMVQWFCLISWTWCMNVILWDYESVWSDNWPKNKRRSLRPIFHGPVILPCILKTVWCMNIILRDYESVWPDVWLKNVGHSDLVSWSIDFALNLEDYLMYDHHTLELWVGMIYLTSK